MEALRGSGVTPAMRDAAERTAPLKLNPLATEFVPCAAALNPLAKEFVPVAAATAALNPLAREFLPLRRGRRELSADAPEFVVAPAPGFYYFQDPTFAGYPPAVAAYDLGNTAPPRTWKRVVDCRLCGDPASGFRFAFVEFQYEEDAFYALYLDGITIGLCPLKLAPSRTAIMPIKHSFLPQITPADLKKFCQKYFGLVSRVRLLGHDNHATQIAFVEFTEANGAIVALSSSGIYVKGLPMRVSPSKTPIRAIIYDKPRRDASLS